MIGIIKHTAHGIQESIANFKTIKRATNNASA